jgi:hypothetical protein
MSAAGDVCTMGDDVYEGALARCEDGAEEKAAPLPVRPPNYHDTGGRSRLLFLTPLCVSVRCGVCERERVRVPNGCSGAQRRRPCPWIDWWCAPLGSPLTGWGDAFLPLCASVGHGRAAATRCHVQCIGAVRVHALDNREAAAVRLHTRVRGGGSMVQSQTNEHPAPSPQCSVVLARGWWHAADPRPAVCDPPLRPVLQ